MGEILTEESLLEAAKGLRLGWRVMSQQEKPKHTARARMEWLRLHIHVLKWHSQSLYLNTIENLWQELKIDVHRCSPFNLTERERFWKHRQKLAKLLLK